MSDLSLDSRPYAVATEREALRGRAVEIIRELHRREPVLSAVGWVHIIALVAMAAVFPFDPRTLGEVSVWVKPMKFAAAIGLYLWTLGWVLHHLKPTDVARVTVLGRSIALAMGLEFLLITSQAARGVASHFNSATPYDVLVYRTMGILIVLNTVCLAGVAVLYFLRRPPLPPAYLWGIRLGLTLFLLTAVSGGIMVRMVSHTVGAAGDLRYAHFISTHALQAMPLAGFLAYRLEQLGSLRHSIRWTFGAAFLLFGLHAAVLHHALAGS